MQIGCCDADTGDLQPTSSRWGRIPVALDCLHEYGVPRRRRCAACEACLDLCACHATVCESAPVPPSTSFLSISRNKLPILLLSTTGTCQRDQRRRAVSDRQACRASA